MLNSNLYNFRDTFFNGKRESASDSDDDSESEGNILQSVYLLIMYVLK